MRFPTRHRLATTLAAAGVCAALVVPAAQASDCTVSRNADCANQDMRHLGNGMQGKNMAGADLSGADMRGMNLINMNLRGANLRGANLTGAMLHGADMTGAKIGGTMLKNVKGTGIKLMKADLSGSTIMGGDWSHSKFTGADLSGITIANANMSHAVFSRSKVKGTARTSVRTAPMARANNAWTWGYFSGVDFSYTQWDGATIQNAVFANRSNFHWAEMKNSDFSGSEWIDANYFETFGIRDSNLSNARFYGNIYMPAFVARTNFDNVACRFVQVPEDRQVIGATHSAGAYFSGQNAKVQGQLTYGSWTIITPTYDFWWTYSAAQPDGNTIGPQWIPTATSAANVTDWRGGCKIVGVNAT